MTEEKIPMPHYDDPLNAEKYLWIYVPPTSSKCSGVGSPVARDEERHRVPSRVYPRPPALTSVRARPTLCAYSCMRHAARAPTAAASAAAGLALLLLLVLGLLQERIPLPAN